MSVVFDTNDRVITVIQSEVAGVHTATIILDNSDKYFSEKDLEGAKINLGFGFEDA